jgi:hypothetical protein
MMKMTLFAMSKKRLGQMRRSVPLAAALLCLPALLHASDWTYRVRPADNLWDLSARYMKPSVPWQKLQDYNKVADPLHLPTGGSLHFPIQWLRVQPAKARVVAVVGNAEARLPGEALAQPIVAGAELSFGTQVITAADASVTLEFADGSRVLVQHDSELALDHLSAYGHTGMVDTRLRLKRGRVSSDVTPMRGSAAHFNVSTPGTISSVRGTHFRVAADDQARHAQTEVVSGKVAVSAGKRRTLVRTGLGVMAADGTGLQPQPLLAAPSLTCPSASVGTFPLALNWPELAGAAHYRVQIAANTRFEALVADRVVDAAGANIDDLPDGAYAVRVHGIDAGQLEGLDAVCTFTVDAHAQPPLVREPQPGSKVAAIRPRFRWTQNAATASYSWQLASDASFARPLADEPALADPDIRAPHALPPGRYYWRVAARDKAGQLGRYTGAVPFDVVESASPEVVAAKPRRGELTLSWQAGADGQRYHVQVARDPDFSRPQVDEVLDRPELSLHKMRSGKLYVRVQTIDSDGYAGAWGVVQQTRVSCTLCRWAAVGGGAVVVWLLLL